MRPKPLFLQRISFPKTKQAGSIIKTYVQTKKGEQRQLPPLR
ncbi:hypothetical protein GS8_2773 [Geobacillus stearothermophilus]|uniref:Uncharacterized protein n=1 Tax=Geobacillus stearothermophilus TaxID=1422 RepID=A0A150M9I2_GEOSE|nr:hypothetical protein GS8_2773 [Geobacillus stearothermophilus]KYD20912.1 hypothetical protein B4109_2493 [Geobacillus stearothermophilus]